MSESQPIDVSTDADLFVEQAEYIDSGSLLKWSTEHPDEEQIIRKLSQGGAKLITGPRGCGKTTLLLKTYQRLREQGSVGSLPIYVNFKSSLKLEPLYRSQSNAVFWFNQWLLFKVYEGLLNTLDDLPVEASRPLRLTREFVNRVTNGLELGRTEFSDEDAPSLTCDILEDEIRGVLVQCNRKDFTWRGGPTEMRYASRKACLAACERTSEFGADRVRAHQRAA